MIELSQTSFQAFIARLYWRDAVEVEPGIFEMRPRRFAFVLRWLGIYRSVPIEGVCS